MRSVEVSAILAAYIAVTLTVQAARFIKRFYVRRFANNINRRMKGILYALAVGGVKEQMRYVSKDLHFRTELL